jgi:D-alanyl-D-alanine carboxypeptidase
LEGLKFYVVSGYRSYQDQCETFSSKINKWIGRLGDKKLGLDYAKKSSAEPGRSQHQLGTTIDISWSRVGYKFLFSMAKTPEMEWLNLNAHHFGFVMSYPWADDDHDGLGYNERTGYFYEPWHWRYVGVQAATEIISNGIILDEYLQECKKIKPKFSCPR